MVDPLSISAGIIDVLQATVAIIRYLRDVHDAPQDRIDLLMEMYALESLLRPLEGRVREATSGDPWFTEIQALGVRDGPLNQLKSDLRRLESKLESGNWLKDIGRRLVWTFTKTEIKDILAKIERTKALASFALENDLFSLSRAIKGESSQINVTVTQIKASLNEQEYRQIADWLSPLNFKNTQREIFQNVAGGTGQWFLESTEFTIWRDGTLETLWCPGIPGAGKTALASIVVHHLQKFFKDENIAILCIFCNYKEQAEQTVSKLIANILKQMFQDPRATFDDVKFLYKLHTSENTRPTLDEFTTAFKSIIKPYSKVFIVIDALDECREDNGTRANLLKVLRSVAGIVNLMITSRYLPSIERDLQGTKRLDIRASNRDVRCYIEERIAGSSRQHLTSLKDTIMNRVGQNVGGMFLLARLHMDSLTGKHTQAAVRRALEDLPKEVDDTYDEAMRRIARQTEDDRELAKQVFSWITYSRRPLSVRELQHALAILPGMTIMDLEGIVDEEILISVCAGLVVIDQEDHIVRLVHYTTQQYFERKRDVLFPTAQLDITMKCLTYLSFDVFGKGYCDNDLELESLLEDYPLLDYAARHWGYHARGLMDEEYSQAALNFLHNGSTIACVSQVLRVDHGHKYTNYSQQFSRNFFGMHMSSFFGLQQIIKCQLEKGNKADPKDSTGRTPLSCAVRYGHIEIVRLLVARGDVEADSRDEYGATPLLRAALSGNGDMVRLLVARKDVQADSKDNGGVTPLSCAAEHGHEEVVRMLALRDDVETDSKDNNGRTPLHWAAIKGREEIVRLLVARDDVEADSKDNYGRTPLCWAVINQEEKVVQLLAARDDVDTDSVDNDGRTPLSWAAEYGYEELVRLLIMREDVEADLKDSNGRTPLSWAASNGNVEVVRLLAAHVHVEADAKDNERRTPLCWAAINQEEEVVRLLAARSDVDPDSKDDYGRTPLCWAAGYGYEGIVRLLLARDDVEADSKDNYLATPLSLASEYGYEEVVRLLAMRDDVDADSRDIDGRTPLSWAAEYGYEEVVRLLLALHHIEADSKDNAGRTPLAWAAIKGHDEVVRLMAERTDVEADSKDSNGVTPLSWAAIDGHAEVVSLLAARDDVNADSKDNDGRTPLSWAAEYGYEEVVRLLTARDDVDKNSRDKEDQMPLSWAARNGHSEVVRLLVAMD